MNETLESQCEKLRGNIKDTADEVKALTQSDAFDEEEEFSGQFAEMKANIMLSYRHLEDARMRLGKVMQQIQGGISKYDKDDDNTVDMRV